MKKTSTEIVDSVIVDFVRNEDKVDIYESVERALFSSMDTGNSGVISKKEWVSRLNDSGIRSDDVRIRPLIHAMQEHADIDFDVLFGHADIDFDTFSELVKIRFSLIRRALTGEFIIPDFRNFCGKLTEIFDKVKKNKVVL